MLEEKITDLKRELVGCATLVEHMIEKSTNGLVRRDKDQLESVERVDEPQVNALNNRMDELCTALIAQYQPRAKDLRVILMILKMNDVLERMGDHAVNIAQSSLFLLANPLVKPLIDIPEMAAHTAQMVKDSITAFINEDGPLAKSVCERDSIIDRLRDKTYNELIEVMSANPSNIEKSLNLLRISRNLERIADLSTNICEDVIFIIEGKIIKHHVLDSQNH
jgi:phosphate transport system protein